MANLEGLIERFTDPLYPYTLDNGCYDAHERNCSKIKPIHIADLRDIFRQFAAEVLRDAAELPKIGWDAYEEGRIDAWLEKRADEIEGGQA